MLQPSVVDAVSATCSAADADERRRPRARSSSRISRGALEPRAGSPDPRERRRSSSALHRLDRRARERADASGLQVRVALEHGKLRACLLERHGPILEPYSVPPDARRRRRPTRVHASVRPLAVRRACTRGSRGRAGHLALSVRRGRRARGLRGARVVLPAVVAHGRRPACDSRVKALEHPLGMARFALTKAGCDPHAVARRAGARPLALPAAKPCRAHRARHHPAPHRSRRRRCGERSSTASSASSCTRSVDAVSSPTSGCRPRSSA